MRRKDLWKKRLYKASAIIMALSMLFGSPMMALAEGNGSANSDLSALESASADLENEAKENATGAQQAVAEELAKELVNPDNNPSASPSYDPSASPSYNPSNEPSWEPSWEPSDEPSASPSPSYYPSITPERTEETTVETETDEDGAVISRETTISRTTIFYGSDEGDEGTYHGVNKEDVEGQTVDYTDVRSITMEETHYYVADESGNIVIVTDWLGDEVKLEIEEDALEDAEEVWAYEKTDGAYGFLEKDNTVASYGTINESGMFVSMPEGTEGGSYYIPTEKGLMTEAGTAYVARDINDKDVVLDEEFYLLIKDGTSEKYTYQTGDGGTKIPKDENGDVDLNTLMSVYDNDGNLIWKGTLYCLERMQKREISVVAGSIVVQDIYGEEFFLDPGTYKQVRESTKVVIESRSVYNTPYDKYTSEDLSTTINGQEYKLTLNFWDNNRIGLRYAKLYPSPEGDHMVLMISFNYADYQGWYDASGTSVVLNRKMVYKDLYPSDFGPEGEAVLTVKYTPEYWATEERGGEFLVAAPMLKATFNDEEEDEFFIGPSEANAYDYERMQTDEEYRNMIYAYWDWIGDNVYMEESSAGSYPVKTEEVFIYPYSDYDYEAKLGKPYTKLEKVGEEEPAPTPSPNPNPNPSPAPSGNTPVAATVSNAAVLGESREQVVEETPEESAVLGEDRPQTGDMAMPFAWLLTMIGCGAASVLALRKKER